VGQKKDDAVLGKGEQKLSGEKQGSHHTQEKKSDLDMDWWAL